MITLQGVGKPIAAGLNTFAVKGCSVLVAVIPGTNDGGSATDYYYKLIIDGKTYQQTVATNNDYIAGSSLSSSGYEANLSASIEYYVIGQSSIPKGQTTFKVTKGTFHGYDYNITNDSFKSFFTVGSYTVIKSFADGDGITMEWLDATGAKWNTNGDQTGSTFNIVSVTDAPNINGIFYLKTKMQFKCKLYNESTGVMKQVTSGEMISFFGHI